MQKAHHLFASISKYSKLLLLSCHPFLTAVPPKHLFQPKTKKQRNFFDLSRNCEPVKVGFSSHRAFVSSCAGEQRGPSYGAVLLSRSCLGRHSKKTRPFRHGPTHTQSQGLLKAARRIRQAVCAQLTRHNCPRVGFTAVPQRPTTGNWRDYFRFCLRRPGARVRLQRNA